MFTPIKVNASGPAVEDERVPAFIVTKDGEDTEYTIPRQISGATAIQALTVFANRGESSLVLWLAEHALGVDGMNAVLESQQLTLAEAKALLTAIGEQYIGQVKELGKE
ncbi:MAG TPA: hypothetical protein VJU17_05890 [Gemmatimonadales bacterium]|nr:hypothetical protein [Gemmatimonadales bacterium]